MEETVYEKLRKRFDRLSEAAGLLVRDVNEGDECPFCNTTDDHDPECRIQILWNALDE